MQIYYLESLKIENKNRKSRKSHAKCCGRILQSREILQVRDFRNPMYKNEKASKWCFCRYFCGANLNKPFTGTLPFCPLKLLYSQSNSSMRKHITSSFFFIKNDLPLKNCIFFNRMSIDFLKLYSAHVLWISMNNSASWYLNLFFGLWFTCIVPIPIFNCFAAFY